MSQFPQPTIVMDQVFKMTDEVCHNHLVNPLDATANVEATTFLIEAVRNIRFPLIRSIEQFEAIWDGIRSNIDAVDFILGATTELRMRVDSSNFATWDQVVEWMVKAYSQFRATSSTLDENLLQRLPEFSTIQPTTRRNPENPTYAELLQDNPWYVFLLLCYHGQTVRVYAAKR